MRSNGVGEVIELRHPDFSAGDKVQGIFGWQTIIATDGKGINKLDPSLSDEIGAISLLIVSCRGVIQNITAAV